MCGGVVCVCGVKSNFHLRLLKAVSIVMTNEKQAFHRFLTHNTWHSLPFLCPVCSPHTIITSLLGNSQWALQHTSLHPLCVFLSVCPYAHSGVIKHLRSYIPRQLAYTSGNLLIFCVLRKTLTEVVLKYLLPP